MLLYLSTLLLFLHFLWSLSQWHRGPPLVQAASYEYLRFRDLMQLDTPHSLRLLWARDRAVVETSAWTHTTFTSDIHASGKFRTHNPIVCGRPHSIKQHGHWDRLFFLAQYKNFIRISAYTGQREKWPRPDWTGKHRYRDCDSNRYLHYTPRWSEVPRFWIAELTLCQVLQIL
jgi:hypothetical protein